MKFLRGQIFGLLALLGAVLPLHGMRLSQFNYRSASVLPVYTHNNIKYGIISREAYGRDCGTYDDFGGSRDSGENHPVITAAREWNEEGLVDKITGMSEQAILDFIDIEKSNNTECIVAFERSENVKAVVYITDVTQYKTKLLHNFYGARNRAFWFKNREKDRIAFVNLTTLKEAIVNHKDSIKPVQVHASVLNPTTNKFNSELVTLRPFFVSKLRFYFLNKPYTEGMNKKIRFYSVGSQAPAMPSQSQAFQSWTNWFKSWLSNSPVSVKQSWSDWFKPWVKK